jgi:hypothetical protein
MTINERSAYIRGLADGVELDVSTKEGKLINALIDLTADMAAKITELEAEVAKAYEYCEELDRDLGSLEEEVMYDDEEDDECDCCCCDDDDDFECDGDCENCDEDCEIMDDDYFEVVCPACGETICFDGDIDPEDIACPACGEKFECVISEDELDDVADTEDVADAE